MRKLAEYLLSFESFQAALIDLGWVPPRLQPKGGGGPGPVDPK